MRLENFRLAHLPKNDVADTTAAVVRTRLAKAPHFYLETCQRYLWLYRPCEANVKITGNDVEVLSGIPAYHFLLRIACGLESKIIAETDIFGQLKTALQDQCLHQAPLSPGLAMYLNKIVEDAKRIRHEYLQGVSTGSYGSIARALVKPVDGDQVLVIGAGSICRAIIPFFSHTKISIWNRTAAKATALVSELNDAGSSASVAADFAAVAEQWRDARTILLCTPYDADLHRDLRLIHERVGNGSTKIILDLGSERARTTWANTLSLTLHDMFEQKNARAAQQTAQVKNAAAACEEYAKLRSLALTQISAHCWEDLHLFVS